MPWYSLCSMPKLMSDALYAQLPNWCVGTPYAKLPNWCPPCPTLQLMPWYPICPMPQSMPWYTLCPIPQLMPWYLPFCSENPGKSRVLYRIVRIIHGRVVHPAKKKSQCGVNGGMCAEFASYYVGLYMLFCISAKLWLKKYKNGWLYRAN